MMAYTNHGEKSSAKRNSSRKPKLSERDCCTLKSTLSKSHRIPAAKMSTELTIHLEEPVLQKESDEIFPGPTSKAEQQLLNL
jgi:hypothetical protein